jgi:hypothetical protein
MKKTKKKFSASIALAIPFFISSNISGMETPNEKDHERKIYILEGTVDNLNRKITILESILTNKQLISKEDLNTLYGAMGVVSKEQIKKYAPKK